MKRKWFGPLLIYVALVILCIIVIYVVPSVKGLLEKTYIAEYGSLDITDDVSGYILRDEVVYVAAQDSELTRLIEPGQLTKAKAKLIELIPVGKNESGLLGIGTDAEITEDKASAEQASDEKSKDKSGKTDKKNSENKDKEKSDKNSKDQGKDKSKSKSDKSTDKEAEKEAEKEAKAEEEDQKLSRHYASVLEELGDNVKTTKKGKSQDAGYVSYYVDGAEAKLSTSEIDDLREKDLKDLCDRKHVETPSKKCRKGDPVFKITRNSRWYYVVFMSNKNAEKYYPGRTVTITVGENSFPAKVAMSDEVKRKTRVVFACKAFYDGFFDVRETDSVITAASAEGLVIQDSSIVEKDGQKGVFIKNKLGERKFKPISIKADDGEKCVVFSDIYVDEEGNFVETLANYDEVVAEPTEEDIKNLKAKK